MNKKKWILNGLYPIITLLAFSLSIFTLDNPVWIAAWIAPVFLIRFMRNSAWIPAVIFGFIVLQAASLIGFLPQLDMMTTTAVKMDFLFILIWQITSGALFYVPSLLIPFILDKALYKHLPEFAASLIYPSTVVAIELLFSLTTGSGYTFSDSQFTLRPLVMAASPFGIFCLSFLVAWFAPMVNYLWEEHWNIKNIGYPGLVYIGIMAAILIYGGTVIAFPEKADETVPVAGITIDNKFYDRLAGSDLFISEILELQPAECAKLMSSPQSHLLALRQKTLEAVRAGAKIVVWQELALMLESSVADTYLLEMKNLADEENIYLLASYGRLLNEKEKKDRVMKNIGILFTPEGTTGWEYIKAYPGAGFEDRMVETGPGNIPYLDTPYGRIGQVICADMIHPHYIMQAAAKKIDLLLVPSYDTTFYTPLLTFSSGYRAVENGFTMIRITGDGHSAVIDPYYRHWAGHNFFEHGSANFYVNVPVVSITTFYSIIGFIFPYLIVLLLASLIVLAIRRVAIKR
jgi:apolipoprotein N-acyltransferase